MKKVMTAMLTMLLATTLLVGCSGDGVTVHDSKGNSLNSVTSYTYTDKDTGCEYIIFDWYQGGGASPKLDEHGNPTGCKELSK